MNASFEDRPIIELGIQSQTPASGDSARGDMQGRKVEKNPHAPLNIGKAAKKAMEAEDILTQKRPPLPRQLSVKSVKDIVPNDQALEAKNGPCWNCIGRSPIREGEGFLYRFELKEEFRSKASESENEAAQEKFEEERKRIYPAIVPSHEELVEVLSNPDSSSAQFLKRLGYDYKNGVLTLPDKEALMALYEKERERRPELPEIHIAGETGIASDSEFIEAFYTSDVLLSSGKEFVHDHFFHVARLLAKINQIAESKASYGAEKFEEVKLLTNAYRKVGMLKQLHSEYKAQESPQDALAGAIRTLDRCKLYRAQTKLKKIVKEFKEIQKPSKTVKGIEDKLKSLLSIKSLEKPEAKAVLQSCSDIMWSERNEQMGGPRFNDLSDDILDVMHALEATITPESVVTVLGKLESPSTAMMEKLDKSVGYLADNMSANSLSTSEIRSFNRDITGMWGDDFALEFFARSFPSDSRPIEEQVQELKEVWSFATKHFEG